MTKPTQKVAAKGRELDYNLQLQGISKWVQLKDESTSSNFKQLAHGPA